jgi:dihydrofolate reductase
MGEIVITENVSLDGVVQDPTGEEGFRHGGWFAQVGDKDRDERAKVVLDEAMGAQAFLLGRRSYEFLAARWPSRNGELANRLNSLPKYVVTSTLQHPDWNNSTVLKGDVADQVSKLKQCAHKLTAGGDDDVPSSSCDGARPRRRATADGPPSGARGRRAPLRGDPRQAKPAPP